MKTIFISLLRNARHYARLGLIILLACCANFCGAKNIPSTVHRIVFLGNSITYAGLYIVDIETYYKIYYPGQKLEFINMGLPSETVSGLSEENHAGGKFLRPDLHERLQRILDLTKPDLVFACYGMNDGIYKPLDKDRFQKFKDGIIWLHQVVSRSGARLVHLTPPIYDELNGHAIGYAKVLDVYSRWLIAQKSQKWEVIDTHFPMKKYFEAHRKLDRKFKIAGFELAADGVHPGNTGHWIIARCVLDYMGEPNILEQPSINAAIRINRNGDQIIKLVSNTQAIMKDAWLTAAGHKRPGMPIGLPLKEADEKVQANQEKIGKLLNL